MPIRSFAVFAACLLALIFGIVVQPDRAMAQSPGDDGDCDDIVFDADGGPLGPENRRLLLACNRTQTNSLGLIYQPEVIRRVVAGRLLGLSVCSNDEEEDENRPPEERRNCAEVNGLLVAPVADVGEPAPQRLWNFWVDGKGTWIESGSRDVSPTDGPLFNGSAGIDYKLTGKVVIGLLASAEASDLDTAGLFTGSTESRAYGGGAYLGVTLYKNLIFNAMVTGALVDTDTSFGGISADIDSDRIQFSAGLTDYIYFGQTRLTPSITFAWSKEFQDSFIDSGPFFNPSQTFETGVITFGNALGRTFYLDGGQAIEPWFGANLDWTLINEIDQTGFGKTKLGELLDLRLQAGLNWTVQENVQLAFTGEVGGLILRDQDSYAGELNLAIQF